MMKKAFMFFVFVFPLTVLPPKKLKVCVDCFSQIWEPFFIYVCMANQETSRSDKILINIKVAFIHTVHYPSTVEDVKDMLKTYLHFVIKVRFPDFSHLSIEPHKLK